MQTQHGVNLLSLVMSVFSLSPLPGTGGDIFTKEELRSTFRQFRGGQKTLPTSADSQLPTAQNNTYGKGAYLEWHILLPFMALDT